MESALRSVRLIQIAMLVSILLYAVLGQLAGQKRASENNLFYAFPLVAITIVGVILVVRRTLVAQSENLLRQRPDDKLTLARWRTGHLVVYVMCDALALLGLVLRLFGAPLDQVWGYYPRRGGAAPPFFSPRPASGNRLIYCRWD
jgi:cytochrome b561